MVPLLPETADAIILAQDKFVWEIPSFEKRERGALWYTIAVLVAVFLVAYAIYTANFLFALLVLLGTLVLFTTSRQDPTPVLVQIGDNGFVINGKLYLFQDLDGFSILYQPPGIKVLYLETRSILNPRLRIELADQNPLLLREHLRQYMKEDMDLRGEYVSDIVGRLLKL